MLSTIGVATVGDLIKSAVPSNILHESALQLDATPEHEALAQIEAMSARNALLRPMLGLGYHDTHTPAVIQRNILENPAWYTPYTPYQAEIAQGRLECLLTFQTAVSSITGLPIANASLLDDATACAEAMRVAANHGAKEAGARRDVFFASNRLHPHIIAVLRTRAPGYGVRLEVGDTPDTAAAVDAFLSRRDLCGYALGYPDTHGALSPADRRVFAATAARWPEGSAPGGGAPVVAVCCTDLLALCAVEPPKGAAIACGNAQRFGVPLGAGGPHAAFFACADWLKRQLPGRLIGMSKDAAGRRAVRMALQTREQHIRREHAASNICTAQALLANCAALYAVWHGPDGLRKIASHAHNCAKTVAYGATALGIAEPPADGDLFFDTVRLRLMPEVCATDFVRAAAARGVNVRNVDGGAAVVVACDETTTHRDIAAVLGLIPPGRQAGPLPSAVALRVAEYAAQAEGMDLLAPVARKAALLEHPVFSAHRSETAFMRYVHGLAAKDLGLQTAMIPLGSCTMKLNAAAEMLPITYKGWGKVHPFAPAEQRVGVEQMAADLCHWLGAITGLPAVSLQPNSGAQGEFAGMLVCRKYHEARGEPHRNVALIPKSAHGTNPASAAMVGLEIVGVACTPKGDICETDLRAQIAKHGPRVCVAVFTYPSTHGVFEPHIREMTKLVRECGGLVYIDGANMNALVGISSPAAVGGDMCHINLHKTFCIPHGGGGPGMGPICVSKQLARFLPGHCLVGSGVADVAGTAVGQVSAAQFGSASILPIPWMYIKMMGAAGLKQATVSAIVAANYVMARIGAAYPVLYTNAAGRCAHEFILDLRPLKKASGVEAEDVAKRLMDYGFHAPTMSFPVPGTLMIEPTESEPLYELDRLCEAFLAIREEIREVESGKADKVNNVLKNAPHTALDVAGEWNRPYSREKAAFPTAHTRAHKFWPAVSRIDNAFGDRNLMCLCPPVDDYSK